MLRERVRATLQRAGFDVRRSQPPGARRASLIQEHAIASVLDVGANVGQYASELREYGFAGSILSFEPNPDSFAQLEQRAAGDPVWECRQLALGELEGDAELLVSSNSSSSSLLAMLDAHRRAAPQVSVVGSATVAVRALDSLELTLAQPLMLKLDVQGFEDRVLRGARRTLQSVRLIECELSVVPLYTGQLVMFELLELLSGEGFRLVGLEPGLRGRDGDTIQFDGLFER